MASHTSARLHTLALAFCGTACSANVVKPHATEAALEQVGCPEGAELLQNGSFEKPEISPGSYRILSALPGWTVAFGPGAEVQRRVVGSPSDGEQLVELDSTATTGIYQDIETTPGTSYVLCMRYSARPGVSLEDNAIEVRVGELPVDTLKADGSKLSDTSWSEHAWRIQARSNRTRIELRGLGPSNGVGGYIDAVSFKRLP